MKNEENPKLVMTSFRNEAGRIVHTSGIVVSETSEEIMLGHNFLGNDILDATLIAVKDIVSIENIEVKEVNVIADLVS